MRTFRDLFEDHDPWAMTHEYLTHHGYEHRDMRDKFGDTHRYFHRTQDREQAMRHAEACGWTLTGTARANAHYVNGHHHMTIADGYGVAERRGSRIYVAKDVL